jgi:hypothetical protein
MISDEYMYSENQHPQLAAVFAAMNHCYCRDQRLVSGFQGSIPGSLFWHLDKDYCKVQYNGQFYGMTSTNIVLLE